MKVVYGARCPGCGAFVTWSIDEREVLWKFARCGACLRLLELEAQQAPRPPPAGSSST